jgi:hypothetical protein
MVRVAGDVAGTAAAAQGAADRLDGSLDRLAAEVHEAARADRETPRPAASSVDGVTLRRIVEQQQQFINVMDHRLSRLGRR